MFSGHELKNCEILRMDILDNIEVKMLGNRNMLLKQRTRFGKHFYD